MIVKMICSVIVILSSCIFMPVAQEKAVAEMVELELSSGLYSVYLPENAEVKRIYQVTGISQEIYGVKLEDKEFLLFANAGRMADYDCYGEKILKKWSNFVFDNQESSVIENEKWVANDGSEREMKIVNQEILTGWCEIKTEKFGYNIILINNNRSKSYDFENILKSVNINEYVENDIREHNMIIDKNLVISSDHSLQMTIEGDWEKGRFEEDGILSLKYGDSSIYIEKSMFDAVLGSTPETHWRLYTSEEELEERYTIVLPELGDKTLAYVVEVLSEDGNQNIQYVSFCYDGYLYSMKLKWNVEEDCEMRSLILNSIKSISEADFDK